MKFNVGDKVKVPFYYGDTIGVVVGIHLYSNTQWSNSELTSLDDVFSSYTVADYDVLIVDHVTLFYGRETFSETYLEAA